MLRTLSIAALLSLSGYSVVTASAADAITLSSSSAAAIAVHDQSAFDWNGFYAGLYTGVRRSGDSGTEYGIGIQAGVNAQFDFYLVGAEVAVEGLTGDVGNTAYGQILGRAGLVVTDDVLVYAAGGYGLDLGTPDDQEALLGSGLELAVSDSMTVRAQYLHSFPTQNGEPGDQVTLGAAFHF